MNLSRTLALWFCLAPIALAQNASLHGTITDAATARPTSCTVEITDANGKVVLDNDSFRGGFRCSGEFTKQLPPGHTRIRVTRGFETEFIEKEVDLTAGEKTELNFVLRRNVDLRTRGWYAGDSHVHMLHGERTLPVSFDFVAQTARAEDLQYMSLAQAWQIEDPSPEALEAQLRPRSTQRCLLTWNLEAPKNYYKGDAGRCLGHCWNVGLRGRSVEGVDVIKDLLEASAWDYESDKPTFANFESHRLIHEQGGAVFYTHPARWWMGPWGGKGGYPKVEQMRVSNMAVELPLDTVLGPTFDGLDVITGSGEFETNEKAFELWKMLLNHGYRLPATGSSDACFDRPGGGIPGTPRTYTYVPNGFSLAKVTRATAQGHTFVSSGPLLVAMLDAQPPGSSFRTGNRNHQLSIKAWASGQQPGGLERLEILRNGQPICNWTWPDHPRSLQTNFVFQEKERCWYSVCLWGSDMKRQRAFTSAFYFGPDETPRPAAAQVHVKVVDAQSGVLLPARVTEVGYAGTLPRLGKHHRLTNGEGSLSIPGTVRLRAEADGYRPAELSPVVDNPKLMSLITGLSDSDLLNWTTFERMRSELSQVNLEFKLEPETKSRDKASEGS